MKQLLRNCKPVKPRINAWVIFKDGGEALYIGRSGCGKICTRRCSDNKKIDFVPRGYLEIIKNM